MKLFMLPCLLEEDCCRFRTIKLEFSKAKEILQMHMKHVHGRPDPNYKCDNCDRDTKISDSKEITEDNNEAEAIGDGADNNEAIHTDNALERVDEDKDSNTARNSTDENQDDIAKVTSVIDDHDKVKEHFEEVQEIIEADNDVVDQIFKPVQTFTEPVSSCRNCGSPDHTSQRKIRKRHCPAWNIICKVCNKRGHLESCCEVN